MRNIIKIVSYILLISLLVGCSNKKEQNFDVNTIFINKDGSIVVAVLEEFDKNYYKQDELKVFIENQISNYNKDTKNIEIQSLTFEDKVAKLIYKFKNAQVFNEFNQNENVIFISKFGEAQKDINKLPDQLIGVKNQNTVKKEQYNEYTKYNIISVVGKDNYIQIKGKIHLYSNNCTFISKDTIKVNNEEMAYIIYK